MAKEIDRYHVRFFGSPEGFLTNRAEIVMYATDGETIGYVRFSDPGMFFQHDSESDGLIRMHLPSALFHSVVDVLRNEEPVYVYFAEGRGFLTTSKEPVGEGEGR